MRLCSRAPVAALLPPSPPYASASHAAHHGHYGKNFCIVNGWANALLNAIFDLLLQPYFGLDDKAQIDIFNVRRREHGVHSGSRVVF